MLQRLGDRPRGAPPEPAPDGGAGEARTDRVDRGAVRRVGVDVGNQRGERNPAQLGGERGREREDVGDHHLGRELLHQRQRVARGVHDRLVEVQRLEAVGGHAVLGCGGESHALGLDGSAPALPCLQRHVVPTRGERASERDHREGVAGVAERAEQHATRTAPGQRAASIADLFPSWHHRRRPQALIVGTGSTPRPVPPPAAAA
ncbi:MAG TPA: hypothetical protein VNV42_04695 [Solirubrobacteraceae bacterium]|nr:hypothetical protein [Solirubrobacteraceae bacterium]